MLTSCNSEKNSEHSKSKTEQSRTDSLTGDTTEITSIDTIETYEIDTLEQRLIDSGLVNIQEINNSILVDVKYASPDNFMEQNMYGSIQHIYLQPEVAERLNNAQEKLKEIDSSLTLLVYDGVRPVWVQQFMWDYLDLPINEKTKFVSNPKNGSLHNYGCAVDVTIAKNDGNPLDMGAGYDDIRKIAYPSMEEHFLSTGELTEEQLNNRKLLRKVMKHGGFWNIQTEWWHFNAFNRSAAKKKFTPIL